MGKKRRNLPHVLDPEPTEWRAVGGAGESKTAVEEKVHRRERQRIDDMLERIEPDDVEKLKIGDFVYLELSHRHGSEYYLTEIIEHEFHGEKMKSVKIFARSPTSPTGWHKEGAIWPIGAMDETKFYRAKKGWEHTS